MDILSGKWKIRIIGELIFGKKRFGELNAAIDGIAAKMLSKELQDLETNQYELTEYGKTVKPVISAMANWGHQHRELIRKKG